MTSQENNANTGMEKKEKNEDEEKSAHDKILASPPSRSVGWLPPHYSALMNGSDTYQRNERNRREFQGILAADRAKDTAAGNPPGAINFPFFLGMGLGLGLNIIGYFAFKAYFRSFLNSVTSFRGQRAGMRRSRLELPPHQRRRHGLTKRVAMRETIPLRSTFIGWKCP
eukprot:CAMPEP_0114475006 /NCGR_PEP_ID=MMETSP0104-20121206/13897_1 /TAXON_ID=37642 ORGANISM="Paraphysomonas imperforata, Strain PA2" /NCGR_SAMPLE_ID=MMETSP0104 /ASSEMBLY_ACC=CAM_ASM_000202 /LENGTH=168 /DNA_ID=CAMNT_0001649453 /DNA_START=116 /DNA_END=619 /DNA_ORIENTATION=+